MQLSTSELEMWSFVFRSRNFLNILGSGKPHSTPLRGFLMALPQWFGCLWLASSGVPLFEYRAVLSTLWILWSWSISSFGLFLSGPIPVANPWAALGFERCFSRLGYVRFDLMRSLLHWRPWIASLCLLAWSMPTTSFTDMPSPLQSLLFRKFSGLVL